MSAALHTPPARFWISRPWVDLLIGCGGLSLPLLAASYVLTQDRSRVLAGGFYSLALLANYPHYMATVYRAYGVADFRAHRAYTVYGTAVLVALGTLAHVDVRLLTLLFSAYVMWSPWHYSGQNYGLLMMFVRRAGVEVSIGERRRLRLAFAASYVMLLATFHEGASSDPLVLSLGLSAPVTRGIGLVCGLLFVGLGLTTLVPMMRRHGTVRFAAPLLLYVTQGLWFVAPIVIGWLTGVAAPQTRYSSGVLALMHAAQYLWITQYFARREQGASWAQSRYWVAVVLGGLALFLPVPWLTSYATHVDFTASMLVVTAVVNLHHFMIDGVVWKLSDPRVGRALTADQAGSAGYAARPASWRRRRPVLLAGALALVILAAVDQWRYWLTLREADPVALATASRLNPFDSFVQGRLLRLLTERGDFEGARAELDRLIDRSPGNIEARINAGVLARRTGRSEDALRHWNAALSADPFLANVQLYLAELLDERGQASEAAARYRAYLELTVQNGRESAEPAAIAAVLIKFGDTLRRMGQEGAARSQFELALGIARKAQSRSLEVEAAKRLTLQ